MNGDNDISRQGKAVTIHAAMRQGAAEFYDTNTPRDALMAAEEGAEEVDRSDTMTAVMAYLFADTPHPAVVVLRLYLLVRAAQPGLLRTLPVHYVQQLLSMQNGSHEWRVSAIIRGTRIERRPAVRHDVVINQTLAAAHHRWRARPRREIVGASETLAAISLQSLLRCRSDEPLADYAARMDGMKNVLTFFFYDSPQPEHTIARVYAMAKAYYSQFIHDMTVRQLGTIFGVEGATWSERIKQKVTRFLEDRGAAGAMARFQKSPEACQSYARAQRGNNNRRGGVPRCA